jgi:hypothetical protein
MLPETGSQHAKIAGQILKTISHVGTIWHSWCILKVTGRSYGTNLWDEFIVDKQMQSLI